MSAPYGTAATDVQQLLPPVGQTSAAPFWDGLTRGTVSFQTCLACGYVRWPCAASCPECLAFETAWQSYAGTGRIWSFCTYDEALHPSFADDVPYVVAAVAMDCGPFVLGRFLSDHVPTIDLAVRPIFLELVPGIVSLAFAPA